MLQPSSRRSLHPVRAASFPIRAATVLAIVLTLAGCGKHPTVLTGRVVFDGEPVANAALEFVPVAGDGKVCYAVADATGRYRAEVSPTKLLVVATATKVVGQMEDPLAPGGPPIDDVRQILPKRYGSREQTPLRATAVEGRSTEIDLQIDPDKLTAR